MVAKKIGLIAIAGGIALAISQMSFTSSESDSEGLDFQSVGGSPAYSDYPASIYNYSFNLPDDPFQSVNTKVSESNFTTKKESSNSSSSSSSSFAEAGIYENEAGGYVDTINEQSITKKEAEARTSTTTSNFMSLTSQGVSESSSTPTVDSANTPTVIQFKKEEN